MSVAMLLKIFSDCCIGFAILASGPVSFALPLLIPALICGVSAGIATFLEGKGLAVPRRMCCVLPFSCLLLAANGQQMLVLAVPAVYTAFVILQGKLELEYYSYRRFFLRSLALVGGVYVAAHVWIFLTQITNEVTLQLDPSIILRYGLVHLLCGVVLQRQLRLGVGNRAEGGRKQMATLLIIAATIVVGFLVAEPLLRQGIGSVLRFILSIVLIPFAFLIRLIAWLFSTLTNTENDQEVYEEFSDYMANIMTGVDDLYGKPQEQPEQTPINTTAIWAVLVGLVLLVAAVLLLRSFHKRRADADSGQLVSHVITAPKKKKVPTFSNRGRVRQLYRDFLRAEKSLGMKLKPCDTSADVLERIHPDTDRPSASDLRNMYLLARYDDRQNISRGQVERAKRALKGTRRTNA